MRTPSVLRVLLLAAVLLAVARAGSAQPAGPATRADASGAVGWLVVDKGGAPYGNHWHSSLFGSVSGGWYWTEHLKTEVDFGAGTEAHSFENRRTTINGHPALTPVESTFSQRTLGLSQQFQFFRNAWFHPNVAVGLHFTWEHIEDLEWPIVIYDDPRGFGRVIEPQRREGPRTELSIRPTVGAGFKAYLTQRGFFRSDFRLAFDGGLDETLLRVGFGIDF